MKRTIMYQFIKSAGRNLLIPVLSLLLLVSCLQAQTPIRSLVSVQGAQSKKLVGYGLVTGLDRSGDRSISRNGAAFTVQSIANMLQRFGITVEVDQLRTRNVAAVMVTAEISAYHQPGSVIDVTVSSLGDASSLRGGVLLQTPLMVPGGKTVYAMAQGPLVTGGVNAEARGARLARNQSLTATIPGGGTVQENEGFRPNGDKPLGLVLRKPSYANADRIARVINENLGEQRAAVQSAGLVQVQWPDNPESVGRMNRYTNTLLSMEVTKDVPRRVVINERTGTVVAGGEVVINEVLVSHGAIQIQTQVTPYVSQPPPLSGGETVQGEVTSVGVTEEAAQNMVIEPTTRVTDLAAMLSNLGLSSRDIISIFQAIDKAGALNGELVVM